MGDEGFVWSGDDADGADEETTPEAAGDDPPDETDLGSPFTDLLEQIGGGPDPAADWGSPTDVLPRDEIVDDVGDIERLVERAMERDEHERAEMASESSGPGPGSLPDTGALSDDSDDSADVAADSDDDPASADAGSDEPDGTSPGDANPFAGLVDSLEHEATDWESRKVPARSWRRDGERSASIPPGSIPDDASSLLLLDPSGGADGFEGCLSLFDETRPERTNLLLVWLSRDITDRLERLYEEYAKRSTNVTVVCRSKVGRRFEANSSISSDAMGENLSFTRISDPRDLPKLGIAISQVISSWEGRSRQVVMCVHSITDLLQFASLERVFRFLHVLQSRIESADATAHYHLDRDAHEEQTVAMFGNLFDVTVDTSVDTEDRH